MKTLPEDRDIGHSICFRYLSFFICLILMVLLLLRFLFGLAMGWAAIVLLMIATLLCLKLIDISLGLFAQRRSQDLASGVCVCALVVVAIGALYLCGYKLYDVLGALPWVDEPRNWLAGSGYISLAALLGAACAIALLAYLRLYANRKWQRFQPRAARLGNVFAAARNFRVGWLPWVLLSLGAALLGLAYAIAPLGLAMQQHQEYADRVWPVYVTAGVLVGAGVLAMLIKVLWLRRHKQPQ